MTDMIVHEDAPMTAAQIRANVNLIQEVMAGVMKQDVHYGIIPGCKKPSLWKAGAEKLMSTFRVAAHPECQDLSTLDEIRFRVVCEGRSPSGRCLGHGVGEASSHDVKWMWRAPNRNEYENTPEDRRRIKYGKDGEEKQVRADTPSNTILKMAKKSAMIDMIITVTAASDIFTQDIEDMDDVPGATEAPPPLKRPAAKTVKADPVPPPQKAQEQAQDAPESKQAGSADILSADDAAILGDGENATIGGVLSWDAEEKKTGNQGKPFYTFKLKSKGQPVNFSHWGEMPDGLKKGVSIIFDCEFKESGGKLYRNASNLRIVE